MLVNGNSHSDFLWQILGNLVKVCVTLGWKPVIYTNIVILQNHQILAYLSHDKVFTKQSGNEIKSTCYPWISRHGATKKQHLIGKYYKCAASHLKCPTIHPPHFFHDTNFFHLVRESCSAQPRSTILSNSCKAADNKGTSTAVSDPTSCISICMVTSLLLLQLSSHRPEKDFRVGKSLTSCFISQFSL